MSLNCGCALLYKSLMNFGGKAMDWIGLIINVVAIFVGLFIYIGISYTKWGKKHSDMQFFIMLVSILSPCIIAGIIRHFVGI